MRLRVFSSSVFLLAVALAAADEPTGRAPSSARADAELLTAARRGDLAALEGRGQAGAAGDAPAPSGEAPLLAAAVGGQVEAARALIDAGATTGNSSMLTLTASPAGAGTGTVT